MWTVISSVLNYVPRVPSCSTCLRPLRAQVPACLHFFTCPTCLHFFTGFMCLHIFRCLSCHHFLRAFIFYVSYVLSLFYVPLFFYVPWFFTCLTCHHFFTCLHFIYGYANSHKLMNSPMIVHCSPFSIIVFNHLSIFTICFHVHRLVSYSAWFFLFWSEKYLLLLMLKRTPDLLKDWNNIWNNVKILEQEIQGMLKPFKVRRKKKIFIRIWLKVILPHYLEFFLARLVYLWFILLILAYSCLLRLGMGWATFYIKKWRHVRHVKKWRHARHVKNEGT